MTHAMCGPWKRTFTLAPLTPLIVFSPILTHYLALTMLDTKEVWYISLPFSTYNYQRSIPYYHVFLIFYVDFQGCNLCAHCIISSIHVMLLSFASLGCWA